MDVDDFPYDFFRALPRQGPGSDAATRKAFGRVRAYIPPTPTLIDFGCGCGAQTLALARMPQLAGGHIIAVDSARPFIEALECAVTAAQPGCAIEARVGDMARPESISGLTPGGVDLVWSESAAYSIGFANALKLWRPLLRDVGSPLGGGCLVVSELSWFTTVPQRRAPEAWEFWNAYYPDMRPAKENLFVFERAGYRVLAHFALPVSAWHKEYYGPMQQALQGGAQLDPAIREMLRQEMDLFAKYSRWYGYTFYCAQAV